MTAPRMTLHAQLVLQWFLASPTAERYGSEIIRETGLTSGCVYPLLDRMTKAGWLTSRSEEGDPKELHRPLRTYYRLTDDGEQTAARLSRAAPATVWLAEQSQGRQSRILGIFSNQGKGQKACQDIADEYFGAANTSPLPWMGDGYSSATWYHPVDGMYLFQVTRFIVDQSTEYG